MRILSVHIETSSLWAEFVNKNGCISVRLVSEEVKSIEFLIFENSHNSFLWRWTEYFKNYFYMKYGSHVRLRHLSCVNITAQWQYTAVKKNAYTSEITFLALNPRFKFIKFGPMEGLSLVKFVIRYYQEVLIKNNLHMGTPFLLFYFCN